MIPSRLNFLKMKGKGTTEIKTMKSTVKTGNKSTKGMKSKK